MSTETSLLKIIQRLPAPKGRYEELELVCSFCDSLRDYYFYKDAAEGTRESISLRGYDWIDMLQVQEKRCDEALSNAAVAATKLPIKLVEAILSTGEQL